MAFKDLRPGSTVYFFYKTSSPKLDIGQVMSEPNTRQKYPVPNQGQPFIPQFPPQSQEQVVDMTVKLPEKVQPVEGLTPTADIQDCGNGLFISCSRDAINAEVLAYKQISDIAISEETLAMHRQISDNCSQILMQLNPEVAERQRIEAENKELKKELSEMKSMLNTLLDQLGSPSKPNNS